jgi:anti-repressor protein
MNELQIFNNAEFGQIRTVSINGEPWFVAKDISDKLGYAQTSNMMKRIDSEDSKSSVLDGMNMKSLVINESGIYSAIIGSKLESAKRFKHWVTSEVLPSIRKNGGYIEGQENLSDEELMAKALMVAQKKIDEKNQIIIKQNEKINEMLPKERFADAVSSSEKSILIGELAKILKQNGIETGEKRLFTWLRDNGYLIKRKGTDYNSPTQKSMELGLFNVKETAITHADGHVTVNKTTKVTGKGQMYFINKFLDGVA